MTSATVYSAGKPPVPGVVTTIISTNCKDHIKWIKVVFEAEQYEIYMSEDNKRVLHSVLGINGGYLYISDPMEDCGQLTQPAGFMLSLAMETPIDSWNRATSNEAIVIRDLAVQEGGNMSGCFQDPFGFLWGIMKATDKNKPGALPYILRDGDCEEHIQWIVTALKGVVQEKMMKDSSVQHCTMEVNGSMVYMADGINYPPMKHLACSNKVPRLMCHMNLPDPYPLWEQLLQNGASDTITLKEQFWGDIYGAVRDPMGLEWSLSKDTSLKDKPNHAGVVPYIRSCSCDEHIEWVQKVFAEEVQEIFRTKEKKIMHCRMSFNGGSLYLCDKACAPSNQVPPQEENSEGVTLHIVLSDPDMVWKKAIKNGAGVILELEQQFWGGYYGSFRDPFGVRWGILKSCGQ